MASITVTLRGHRLAILAVLRPLASSMCGARSFATNTDSNSDDGPPDDAFSDAESAAETEAARNVSKLSPNHYRQYHGQAPEVPYKDLVTKRRLFSSFGFESQEDPRIMWPSRDKLLAMEQEEREEGRSLQDRLKQLQEEKDLKEKAKIERRKMIEKTMSQMPKVIADYKKRLAVADQEVQKRLAKKEDLLEEAREYFGYKIRANDPKFEQMVEEKAEEEKKQAKKLRKEEKLKKAADRLAQEAKMYSEKNAQK